MLPHGRPLGDHGMTMITRAEPREAIAVRRRCGFGVGVRNVAIRKPIWRLPPSSRWEASKGKRRRLAAASIGSCARPNRQMLRAAATLDAGSPTLPRGATVRRTRPAAGWRRSGRSAGPAPPARRGRRARRGRWRSGSRGLSPGAGGPSVDLLPQGRQTPPAPTAAQPAPAEAGAVHGGSGNPASPCPHAMVRAGRGARHPPAVESAPGASAPAGPDVPPGARGTSRTGRGPRRPEPLLCGVGRPTGAAPSRRAPRGRAPAASGICPSGPGHNRPRPSRLARPVAGGGAMD